MASWVDGWTSVQGRLNDAWREVEASLSSLTIGIPVEVTFQVDNQRWVMSFRRINTPTMVQSGYHICVRDVTTEGAPGQWNKITSAPRAVRVAAVDFVEDLRSAMIDAADERKIDIIQATNKLMGLVNDWSK